MPGRLARRPQAGPGGGAAGWGLRADAGGGHPGPGQRGRPGWTAGSWGAQLVFQPLLETRGVGGEGGGSWAHPKGVVILAERLCWAPGGTAAGAPFGSCPGRAPSLRLRLVGLQGRQGMLGGAWAQVRPWAPTVCAGHRPASRWTLSHLSGWGRTPQPSPIPSRPLPILEGRSTHTPPHPP